MNVTYKRASTIELEPDEPTLIRLSQIGDRNMFAHLSDAYQGRIYRYVYFRVPEDEPARELASQIFLKAWERLNTYQPGYLPFMAWLYRIAQNAVVDHYRMLENAIALEQITRVELSPMPPKEQRI